MAVNAPLLSSARRTLNPHSAAGTNLDLHLGCLMRSPADAQIELLRRADRGANEDGCVGWIGQRNICQLVHAHSRGNGYCRHFRDVHRALADDVTAQYFARLALDDQFAKAKL